MTADLRANPAVPPEATPGAVGYAMPAEWEEHAATWIAWPHNRADWPGKFEPVPWVFAEIVRHLAEGERVHILVQPGKEAARRVKEMLRRADVNLAHVTLHAVATDRVWVRDSGPIFVTRRGEQRSKKQEARSGAGRLAAVDFKFNAWAKYDNSARDDAVPAAVAGILGVSRFAAFGENSAREWQRFVLEGGSIDVNGDGALLTTEECLLSKVQQRNPGFSRGRIESTLQAYLGVEEILWLGRGIAGDDTHGHVDDVARFVNRTTIAACVETDRRDANFAPLAENLRRLKRMRDRRGRQFEVVELPLPAPVYFDGVRLPASYANFYIGNAGALVPVFNDPMDGVALRILEGCFRDRPVIPIYCRDLVWGLGTIHCMTQQEPATTTATTKHEDAKG